jgi:hypothetical protein
METIKSFNVKSFVIGVLSAIIILLCTFLYFEGEDYRQLSKNFPLTHKEYVGNLPDGKALERYLIPYRGRIHYVYVTNDTTTINKKSMNGRTTNMETEVYVHAKK